MSLLNAKSPKHCAAKQGLSSNLYKKFFFLLFTLLALLLSLAFLVWFVIRPTKPQFGLQQADILQLDYLSTSPHLLNSSIQLTLISKNPNSRVGIYYDQFQVYASYKGQQITVDSSLPPFYQGHNERNILTASLVGSGLAVAPSFGYEVARDQTVGKLVLNLKVNGRIRWKIGTWVSGRYRLSVNCAAVMDFGPSIPSGPLSSKQGNQCSTIV